MMISAFDECSGSGGDKDHMSRILKDEKCVRKGVNLVRRSTHGLNNMHLEIQTLGKHEIDHNHINFQSIDIENV